MIRGKKNFLPPVQLVYGFGYLFKLDESSIGNHINDNKRLEQEEDVNDEQESLDAQLQNDGAIATENAEQKQNVFATTNGISSGKTGDEKKGISSFPSCVMGWIMWSEMKMLTERAREWLLKIIILFIYLFILFILEETAVGQKDSDDDDNDDNSSSSSSEDEDEAFPDTQLAPTINNGTNITSASSSSSPELQEQEDEWQKYDLEEYGEDADALPEFAQPSTKQQTDNKTVRPVIYYCLIMWCHIGNMIQKRKKGGVMFVIRKKKSAKLIL